MSAVVSPSRFESLEARQFFSAATFDVLSTLRAAGHNVIGATSGSVASANPTTTAVLVESEDGTGDTQNANLDTAIQLKIQLSTTGGVKETSLNRLQFAIFAQGSSTAVTTGNVQTSGGGDVLIVKPSNRLLANTNYTVQFNQSNAVGKITDVGNVAFDAATYTFRTGTFFNQGDPNIVFTKTTVKTRTSNGSYSAVTIGPDNRLYAGTLEGYIYRYDINSDGTLANETQLTIVRSNNGGARFITGLTFDPRSTDPANPVLWVSHGQAKFGDSPSQYADNYTGKISRLYNNLTTYEDVIVNIPRSVKDHLNNQISFDPVAKSLYFVIPSMSAMGREDSTWGNEPETVTTAALFRLQLRTKGTRVGIEEWLATKGAINLDPNSAQNYNPYKGTNPLRFYATGIRNAYDMVWHSNGHLYMPSNGSAAGGNTPATPSDLSTVPYQNRLDAGAGPYTGPTVPALSNVQQFIDDYLFDVEEGGYYGHPNPSRGEYVLNGGDPTAGTDPAEIRAYADGTAADRNYRGAAFTFGKNQSPDGVIEYKSGAFGGLLKGSLIVARYSSGDDLTVIKPKADGTFDQNDEKLGIQGFTGFTDNTGSGGDNTQNPLDLVEDTRNGNIYVVSLVDRYGDGAISLLKPQITAASSPQAETSVPRLGLYVTPGGAATGKSVTLTNGGDQPLTVDVSATKITGGAFRRNFGITNLPTSDFTLDPGESYTFNVIGALRANQSGTAFGNLAIATNDPDGTYAAVVQLRAFNLNAASSASAVASDTSTKALASVSANGGSSVSFGTNRIGTGVLGTDAEWGVGTDESGQDLLSLL